MTTRQNWDAPRPPSRLLVTLADGTRAEGDLLAVSGEALLLGAAGGERCVCFDEVRTAVIRLPRPPEERTTSVPLPLLGLTPASVKNVPQDDVISQVDVTKLKSLKAYAVWKDRPVPCTRPDAGAPL